MICKFHYSFNAFVPLCRSHNRICGRLAIKDLCCGFQAMPQRFVLHGASSVVATIVVVVVGASAGAVGHVCSAVCQLTAGTT